MMRSTGQEPPDAYALQLRGARNAGGKGPREVSWNAAGQCGDHLVVAFACKKRGFYPSCVARRMSDAAAHSSMRCSPKCQCVIGCARSRGVCGCCSATTARSARRCCRRSRAQCRARCGTAPRRSSACRATTTRTSAPSRSFSAAIRLDWQPVLHAVSVGRRRHARADLLADTLAADARRLHHGRPTWRLHHRCFRRLGEVCLFAFVSLSCT